MTTVCCDAVYFGGLGEKFFNNAVEATLLERVTGTFSMFMFPIIIYFCIFSFMVCSTPLVTSLRLEQHALIQKYDRLCFALE